MRAPLEVFSELQLNVDGETVDIRADGSEIMVDVPTLRAARRLMASEPLRRQRRFGKVQRIHDALHDAGLTLDVRLTGESIARMGRGAQSGQFEALLNLEGMELHPVRSLRSVVRRRPFLALIVGGSVAFGIGWLLFRRSRS